MDAVLSSSLHILVVEPNQVLQRLVHAWLVSNNFKDTLVSDVEVSTDPPHPPG